MNKEDLLKVLYGKQTWDIYKKFQNIEKEVLNSNKYYNYIDEFIDMLNKEPHIKLRGFKLICRLSQYDSNNKIENNIDLLLSALDVNTPSIIRQCLDDIPFLLTFKPHLSERIKVKLNNLNLTKYKDTMKPLIEKDIQNILNRLK